MAALSFSPIDEALSDSFAPAFKPPKPVKAPEAPPVQLAGKIPTGEGKTPVEDKSGIRAATEAKIAAERSQRDYEEAKRLQSKGETAAKQAREAEIYAEYKPRLTAPYEQFKPTGDSISGLASLGLMIGMLGAMGGKKGLTSATGAMNAIAGMMDGYQKGNKEKYDKERQVFEENLKIAQQNHALVEKEFERAVKYAKYDLNGATNSMIKSRLAAGDPVTAKSIQEQGLVKTAAQFSQGGSKVNNQINALKEKMIRDQEAATRAEAEVKARQAETKETKDVKPYSIDGSKEPRLMTTSEALALQEKGYQVTPVTPAGARGSQQAIQAGQRMINATAGAASGFEAITNVKGGTTTGILPYLSSKEGITNFLGAAAGRKLTSDDSKILDVYYTGIARNLAAIESSGAATGLVGLTKSFENLKPAVGDSNYVVAAKLADAKRVVEETMNAAISSGTLTSDQQKTALDLVKRIERAVPFTIDDVNKAVTKGKPTIGKTTSQTVLGKPTIEQFLSAARAANPAATDEQLIEYYNKKYGGK